MKKAEIGKYVARRRKGLGVSQRELARICGISEHALCNLEQGIGNPTLDLLAVVLEVLGLELHLAPRVLEGA